jgi:hypothetical protein
MSEIVAKRIVERLGAIGIRRDEEAADRREAVRYESRSDAIKSDVDNVFARLSGGLLRSVWGMDVGPGCQLRSRPTSMN